MGGCEGLAPPPPKTAAQLGLTFGGLNPT